MQEDLIKLKREPETLDSLTAAEMEFKSLRQKKKRVNTSLETNEQLLEIVSEVDGQLKALEERLTGRMIKQEQSLNAKIERKRSPVNVSRVQPSRRNLNQIEQTMEQKFTDFEAVMGKMTKNIKNLTDKVKQTQELVKSQEWNNNKWADDAINGQDKLMRDHQNLERKVNDLLTKWVTEPLNSNE